MKFGVFDHMDEAGVPLAQQFEERLQLVEAYERANWDVASGLAADSAIADELLPDIYVAAVHWAAEQMAG